jgi:hypothetical protein
MRPYTIRLLVLFAVSVGVASCAAPSTLPAEQEQPAGPVESVDTAEEIDLTAVKDYAVEHAAQMKVHTEELVAAVDAYYAIIAGHDFDYGAAWEAEPEQLGTLVEQARTAWKDASLHYELNEGIVAGVPQLADYDTWIDAGPPASESPDEAYEWTLALPNGETMESPGNLFHTLLEPALYGTNPDYVGLPVDLDGDGEVALAEVLPDANLMKGAADALDGATAELIAAIDGWEPTLEDAFTALVVMTPTMSEYFEQWKLSVYVAGDEYQEASFVGLSRLFDITSILNGLVLTYDTVSPLVAEQDDTLNEQIATGYADLSTYVEDLYEREQSGSLFTAEEADLLGSEAQGQAEDLAALLSTAANQLSVPLTLD